MMELILIDDVFQITNRGSVLAGCFKGTPNDERLKIIIGATLLIKDIHPCLLQEIVQMLSKDLYQKMKQLHKETGAGFMICRHILEKYNSDYEQAIADINSQKYNDTRRGREDKIMTLNDLLHLIHSQENRFSDKSSVVEAIVSLEVFFEGSRPDSQCFAANTDLQSSEMYSVLKQIQSRSDVQDIWVVIYEEYEEDECWAYAEECIISTSAEEIAAVGSFFSEKSRPSEIYEIDTSKPIYKNIPLINDGFHTFSCWWD